MPLKDLIVKADRMVLRVVSHYVKRWIAHHEEKKHKIDFLILAEKCRTGALVIWALAIPAALWAIGGEAMHAGIHVVVWGILATMEWFGIELMTRTQKMFHDFRFAARENPQVYESEKLTCHLLFEESRRRRLTEMAIMGAFVGSMFLIFAGLTEAGDPNNLVWQFLLANTAAGSILRYVPYVFDFEPPKKKKKASERISEMLTQLWKELTEGFAPAPAYRRA